MRKYLALMAFVLAASMLVVGALAAECYQESATVDNQSGTDGSCGLQYTGNYLCEGTWDPGLGFPCQNVYDGNWNTFAFGEEEGKLTGYLFINYTKPEGATSDSLWQASGKNPDNSINVTNFTISEGCLSQDNLMFKLTSDSASHSGNGACYDGAEWVEVFNRSGGHSEYLYEEGVWWDITATYWSFPPVNISDCTELNETGQTYLLTADIDTDAETCIEITADNVMLDCQGHTINGNVTGIYATGHSGITIRNCVITDFFTEEGLGGWALGIWLNYGSNNTVYNNTFTNIDGSGFELDWCYDTTFYNNTFVNNWDGFDIYDSYNIIIYDSTIDSSVWDGFCYYNITDSTFHDNIVSNNTEVACINDDNGQSSSNNIFYNNLFNNSGGFSFENSSAENFWNTTKQAGTRIYSDGDQIGGNYWTNSTSNGYSDTCADDNTDGFCDEPYEITTDNIDYLALSDGYGATYITATFNYANVEFPFLLAGSSAEENEATSWLYNVSVDTNAPYEVSAYGTNFTDGGGHDFYIGNLWMDTDTDFDVCPDAPCFAAATALTESPQVIDTAQTGAISYHGWWLGIPAAQYAAHYTSTVTITYANV
jgi:parallel beta-helix repeat protein